MTQPQLTRQGRIFRHANREFVETLLEEFPRDVKKNDPSRGAVSLRTNGTDSEVAFVPSDDPDLYEVLYHPGHERDLADLADWLMADIVRASVLNDETRTEIAHALRAAADVLAKKMTPTEKRKMEQAAKKRGTRMGKKLWVEVTQQPKKARGGRYIGRAAFMWQKDRDKKRHSVNINVGTKPAKLKITSKQLKVHPKDGTPYTYGEAVGTRAVTKTEELKEKAGETFDKVRSFLSQADENTQRFFIDPEYRKETLLSMAGGMRNLPKVSVKRLVHATKEEVKEFAEAALGVGKMAVGKPMNEKERHALGIVTMHLAVSVAAAAATRSGIGIAGGVAIAMARGIAAKAISPSMEKVHLGEEITHAVELFAAAETDEDPMVRYAQNVANAMADYLETADLSREQLVKLAAAAADEEAA